MEADLDAWLSAHQGRAAIVFSDVVDSTALLFRKETVDYRRSLRRHVERAGTLIAQHDGHLIEDVGDQLFAAFGGVDDAVAFAKAFAGDPGHPDVAVRVGVHVGSVRVERAVLVGRAVHIAARVMQHGAAGECWLSDAAKRALPTGAGRTWLACEDAELKGLPERMRLWRAA